MVDPEPPRRRLSSLGIASVSLAAVSWLCWLSIPLITRSAPGGPMDGVLFIPSAALRTVSAGRGLVLGIAGLLQPGYRRELPVAGILMSLLPGVLVLI
jgi:hypothetical protein